MKWNWLAPPGASSRALGRSIARKTLVGVMVGSMTLGAAYAGAVLVPTNVTAPVDTPSANKNLQGGPAGDVGGNHGIATTTPPDLNGLEVMAGASKISLEPRPEEFGGTWNKNFDECKTFALEFYPPKGDHLASTGSPWNENPNCLYMGGFDLGPSNPIVDWDQEYGLWVRSFAVKGSNGKTLTLTIIDGEGYFWDYKSKCDDCGVKQISAELANDPELDLGLEKEGIVIAATHAHSSMDFIGGWGFVPDWYMDQTHQAIKDSIIQAVRNMQPATLETGEVLARPYNSDRRDTYRSPEEQHLTWIRALAANSAGGDRAIATIGAYAAHPTTKGTNNGKAHADFPALFEKRVEDRFGGVGLYFMTGLGNMSSSGGTDLGARLADLIPEVGGGTVVTSSDPTTGEQVAPEVKYAQTTWGHPATNVPLTTLGFPGFFDREFLTTPAEVRTGKSPNSAPCESASPMSVEMPASAARIGNTFALTASPGEIFSNISNTIKEKSGALVTMPIGQANDALGYMPQAIELNPVGQQGLGFVAGGAVFVNYEDAYSVDRCMGDKVLETNIELLGSI